MTAVRRAGIRQVSGLLRRAASRLPLPVALLEESDADLVAIDPGQLATTIGEPGGRQEQEKFLQVQAFDRSLDGEFRAGFRHVLHSAIAPPGAVDSHHMRRYPALEGDAVAVARHVFAPASCGWPVRRQRGLSQTNRPSTNRR